MRFAAFAAFVLAALALGPALPVRAGDSPATPTPAVTALPVVGRLAPDFTLPSTTGKDVTLSKLRGQTVVLYFYPKDESAGCTKEACDFRDHTADLDRAGVLVLGVSTDGLASHRHFRQKEKLPFPLLADVNAAVSKRYGVYGQQGVAGFKYTGIQRTTFVIGRDGRVARVWPKVSVSGHVEEILKYVSGSTAGKTS